MIGASNYCMQILSTQNREELVKAHSKRYWLHIGVPSIRNLFRIRRDRSILWLILVLSSVPLHLLFNSTMFASLQANQYLVVVGTDNWIKGGDYEGTFLNATEAGLKNITDRANDARADSVQKVYEKMGKDDCVKTYDDQYLSAFGNVIMLRERIVWRNSTLWGFPTFQNDNPTCSHQWSMAYMESHSRLYDDVTMLSDPKEVPSNSWRQTDPPYVSSYK
ncbi:hypothetical protein BCR34DRAFT_173944 [Clohesyomyces aquaticus]|uniref:DUF6536 domain-containing protein n=1 Tax=Clohesyomyces aquaticus TaxID=1231657 RepID=A0A1Y1YG48_9PLEO|nr:hypothetical protein BCR34DRAFT_173944 [Clohesyomyces aquaticus]